MSEQKIRMSDEEFMKNYDRHNKSEGRSEKYVKGEKGNSIRIGYWIFIAVSFLAAYYLFSEFFFQAK